MLRDVRRERESFVPTLPPTLPLFPQSLRSIHTLKSDPVVVVS